MKWIFSISFPILHFCCYVAGFFDSNFWVSSYLFWVEEQGCHIISIQNTTSVHSTEFFWQMNYSHLLILGWGGKYFLNTSRQKWFQCFFEGWVCVCSLGKMVRKEEWWGKIVPHSFTASALTEGNVLRISFAWSWDLTPACPWNGAGGPEHLYQHCGLTFSCENKCLSDLINQHLLSSD